MFEYIRELFGLADDNLDDFREWHAYYVPKLVVGILLLLALGFFLNLAGAEIANIFICILLVAAGLILFTRPEPILGAIGLGIMSGATQEPQPAAAPTAASRTAPAATIVAGQVVRPNTMWSETSRFFQFYARTAAKIMFWLASLFLMMGIISVKENPVAFWVILAASAVAVFYAIGWKHESETGRRAMYGFACLILVISFLSLIPRHTWYRMTGADVKGFLASTEAEIGVSAVEQAEKEQVEKAKRIFLEGIERKVRQGVRLKDLPKEDLKLYRELKAERNSRSLGSVVEGMDNTVKSWWDNVSVMRKANAENRPPKPEPIVKQEPMQGLPAPPPPPAVTPKPVEMPEWELCTEIKNRYARRDERCSRVKVEFKKYNREIVITQKYGVTTIFQGFQTDAPGHFEGNWSIQERNYTPGYGQFYLEFDPDSSLEYARGEKIHKKGSYAITLKRIVLLRDHE